MLIFDGFFGLVMVGIWIFCFVDVLLTPAAQIRNLPKLAWVFIVLLLPTLGSIAWLVAGRPWVRTASGPASLRTSSRWSDDREPMRAVPARNVALAPDDDEEFLAGLRRRADEQGRRAREARERDQGDRPGSAD